MTKVKAVIKNFERTIADMEIGEIGYVVPWAYDASRGMIDDSFNVRPDESETYTMKIRRAEFGIEIQSGTTN